MLLSRRIDDKEIQLKRQNKIFFQISGAGHEGVLAAAAKVLRPAYDWFYLYYRDRALCLGLGMTATEQLLSAVGAADDPNSGGRQMPSHWGHKDLNIVSASSPTGTQFLQAVGAAEAWLRYTRDRGDRRQGRGDQGRRGRPLHHRRRHHQRGRVLGGAQHRLQPQAPRRLPGRGQRLRHLRPGRGQHRGRLDLEAGHRLSRPLHPGGGRLRPARLLRRPGEGGGVRPGPEGPRAGPRAGDPALQPLALGRRDALPPPGRARGRRRARPAGRGSPSTCWSRASRPRPSWSGSCGRWRRRCRSRPRWRSPSPQPPTDTVYQYVYSPDVDPTSEQFDTEDDPALHRRPDHDGRPAQRLHEGRDGARSRASWSSARTWPTAAARRALGEVKGKGGVFKVTWGLQRAFGSNRVYNSPLAEANIVGRAIGLATRGLKPVVEIQFFDYIWPAYMQIRNELAIMRWRSNNAWASPVVVRVTYGGYLKGGALVPLARPARRSSPACPGFRVVCPATALDANGLLRTAIRCEDPVHLPGAQAPLPPDLQQGAEPGPELHDPVREGQGRAAGHRSDGRDLRRPGAALARGREGGRGAARDQHRGHRPALALAGGLGDHR